MDIGFAVDHVGIVDDEQIVDALLGSELLEIERGLPVAVEFTRVDDDDFTVMAGEKRDERIAIGLLQHQAGAALRLGLDDADRRVAADEASGESDSGAA